MLKKILIGSSCALLLFTGCASKDSGMTVINEKGKYGTLESDGQVVVKPVYDELSAFDEIEDKNIKNQHPNYVNLHWLHDNNSELYAIAEYKGKYGIVNNKNEMVVKPIYDSISKKFNGFFIIKLNDKFGYMNDKFEIVQKPIFKSARDFVTDVTFVQSTANSKWGCITKEMELKVIDEFNEVYSFVDGLARVVKDSKWGYIDNQCNLVVEPKYEYAYDFSNGFGKVKKDGHIAYLNSKGEEVTKAIFTSGKKF